MNRSKFDLESFFPRLRRGHSLGAHSPVVKVFNTEGEQVGTQPRKHVRCAEDLCVLNNPKSRVKHIDQAANIADWEEERRQKGLLYMLRLRNEQGWKFQQPAAA